MRTAIIAMLTAAALIGACAHANIGTPDPTPEIPQWDRLEDFKATGYAVIDLLKGLPLPAAAEDRREARIMRAAALLCVVYGMLSTMNAEDQHQVLDLANAVTAEAKSKTITPSAEPFKGTYQIQSLGGAKSVQ